MCKRFKRLGDAELEIMQILWRENAPLSAGQIHTALQGQRSWALSTLMTVLARLADKGFVECVRTEKPNRYTALVAKTDYQASESRSFLARLYGNSVQSMMATLYDSRMLDGEDVRELRAFLDELEQRSPKEEE